MSIVTTVVIVHGYEDRAAVKAHAEAFTGTSQGATPHLFRLHHADHVGGYKCAENEILVGAYNHFDVDGFFVHLGTYPWRSPGEVAVICATTTPVDQTVTWTPGA